MLYGQGAVAASNTADYSLATGKFITLPAGNHFSTQLGSNGGLRTYTVITDLGLAGSTTTTDLQGMLGNLAGNYALGADIDASATLHWNADAGFDPVGTNAVRFTGTFTGLGHTITGLTINRPATDYVGLFGATQGATLRNVGLVGGTVTGQDLVSGLVGQGSSSNITNVYNTGTVSGQNAVGGLIGESDTSIISNAYSTGAVSGHDVVGGLIGDDSTGLISNVYSTGTVSGHDTVGGLMGANFDGTFSHAYSTGTVTGANYVGGLIGYSYNGTISTVYSTGTVSGTDAFAGGLLGYGDTSTISTAYSTGNVSGVNFVGGLLGHAATTSISNAYSTGAVVGVLGVGGLVGYSDTSTISNVYSTGAVSGTNSVGGLIGQTNGGSVSNAYWDTQTSGQASSADGTGITTADRLDPATYAGFNFSSVWTAPSARINQGYPTLQALPVAPTIIAIVFTATLGKTYGATLSGSLAAADFSYTGSLLGGDSLSGLTFTSSGTAATANIGSYGLTFVSPTGTLADLSAYTFSFSGGSALNVGTRAITVSASGQRKFAGTANPQLGYSLTLGSLVNNDQFSGGLATTVDRATAAGSYAITVGTLNLSANYTLTFTPGAFTVTPTPASGALEPEEIRTINAPIKPVYFGKDLNQVGPWSQVDPNPEATSLPGRTSDRRDNNNYNNGLQLRFLPLALPLALETVSL